MANDRAKIDWSKEPEWCQFRAIDDGGREYRYDKKPRILLHSGVWYSDDHCALVVPENTWRPIPTGGWTKSLEERPPHNWVR